MNKEQNEQIKKMSNSIQKVLDGKELNLSQSERAEFESLQTQLDAVMLSQWLPADWIRRIIMFAVLILTLYLAFTINPWFLLLLFMVCILSPRFVGELTILFGKMRRK